MNMVMDVTTENGGCMLPYLFHCGKRDVQVAHGSLWKAFHDLTFFQESETTTRLLTGISDLQWENGSFWTPYFYNVVVTADLL